MQRINLGIKSIYKIIDFSWRTIDDKSISREMQFKKRLGSIPGFLVTCVIFILITCTFVLSPFFFYYYYISISSAWYWKFISPQVLLWTGVTEQLIVQTIPGCSEMCPFEDLLDIIKDILPNDDEYYCRRNKTENLKPHHRSSATRITGNGSWWYIFLTVLLVKFVHKWSLQMQLEL